MILDDQHTEKESYRKTSDSASAATNHSPAEVEENNLENKRISHNIDHIKENSTQNSNVPNQLTDSNMQSIDHHFPNNTINKTEDFNSSRESIDVETTQTEDVKPFANINTTTTASTEAHFKSFAESSKEPNSAFKQENENPSVDWSTYHLGDMALDVWLQTVRKHIVLALIRHPK